jgi:CRISPR/Cas system-associated endonuclease/helicase Cas3
MQNAILAGGSNTDQPRILFVQPFSWIMDGMQRSARKDLSRFDE